MKKLMHFLCPWVARPALCSLSLAVLVSCKKAPSENGKPDSESAGTPSVSSAAAPASPASAKPVAATPKQPREHHLVLALIDFSTFPPFEGASRQSTSSVYAGFSFPWKDASSVQQCREVMEKFLAAQGWTPAPGGGGDWGADGGSSIYSKDGASALVNAGVSAGSAPGGKDVNAGIFLIGDVDVRLLPLPAGSKKSREDISSAQFSCPAALMEVRKQLKELLSAQGWAEYRMATPAGYEPPVDELAKTQSFAQNGATINYRFEEKDGGTVVSLSSSLMGTPLPIPPQADMLKLQDSPPLLSCFVKMTPDQVLAWSQETLGKQGWTSSPAPPSEENAICHRLQKAGRKPLLLEYLPSGSSTLMRLREIAE